MNKLTILINGGNSLDIFDQKDLGLKLNRILEDLKNPAKRYSDFSYTLKVPKTKNNNILFEHRGTFSGYDKFNNQYYSCTVRVNNTTILRGSLTLLKTDSKSYRIKIKSNTKDIVDLIGDSNVRDLTNFDEVLWEGETTIANHLNNVQNINRYNSDIQFPLIWYQTIPTDIADLVELMGISGSIRNHILSNYAAEDLFGDVINQDLYLRYNYIINNWTKNGVEKFNTLPQHFFPPAIYVLNILEKIFEAHDWKLQGTFLQNVGAQNLILPYNGSNEVWNYGKGIRGRQTTTGIEIVDKTQFGIGENLANSSYYLSVKDFLPNVKQKDFLKSIINMFNLFMTVDVDNKIVYLDTYDSYFLPNDLAFDITSKIDFETWEEEEYAMDISISYKEDSTDGVYQSEISNPSYNEFKAAKLVQNKNILDVFTTTKDVISLPFAFTFDKKFILFNKKDINGLDTVESNICIPVMSKQGKVTNEKLFHEIKQDVMGYDYNANRIDFSEMDYSVAQRIISFQGATNDPNHYVTLTGNKKAKISFSTSLHQENFSILDNIRIMQGVNYPATISLLPFDIDKYISTGNENSVITGTNKSLKDIFYKNRIDSERRSNIVTVVIRITAEDYNQMQLNVPLRVRNLVFRLVKLDSFDPVQETAILQMKLQL